MGVWIVMKNAVHRGVARGLHRMQGITSMAPVELFQSFPFLVGADLALPASADGAFTVTLNGRSITVPAWPSESEGAVVVVFE